MTIDTGRATAAQLALITTTYRAESEDDAAAPDAEVLAHVRNTSRSRARAYRAGIPSPTTAATTPPR